jgi:hypothetical protein
MSIRTVRDKDRVLRFEAEVLATATSKRPGAVRWSELVVYRLPSQQYVISKIGRSVLAHRPDCYRVYPDMPTWLEAGEEAQVHREPCAECLPVVGSGMDPQTVLEATRYTVLQARDPENLYRALHNKRGRTAGIVEDILQQLTVRDQLFADWISLARL